MSFIKFENDRAVLKLSEKGVVEELFDKECGVSVPVKKEPFAKAFVNGNEVFADTATLENTCLTIGIGNEKIVFEVKTYPDYFEIILTEDLPNDFSEMDFIRVTLDEFSENDETALFSYALTENVNENMYPDGSEGKSVATVMKPFSAKGARVALVYVPNCEICQVLKNIHKTLSKTDRAISSIAGPYSREYAKNHGNYIITSDTRPENLESYIEFYTEAGVTQLDFHQGPNSFRQGDFYFHHYNGSADEFREKFAKPLSDKGILSGLHTYAYYIDPSCAPILSDEKWQKQLCILEEFTLAEDMSEDDTTFKICEDVSTFSTNHTFFSSSLPYLLIDNEIISVKPTADGFESTGRARAGTKAMSHKKGAKVKHPFGRFCMFTPIIGSELFIKIARDTADAYNRGGFEMIYLDALDGIGHHCPKKEAWYWAGQFVSEIVKNCNTDPIIEYSTMYPSIWATRGRMGAWDTPFRAYKDFVKGHVKANDRWEKRQYTTTLGWYMPYPVHEEKVPPNYSMRYQFEDDIDFVGTQAFVNGSSMVYLGLTRANFEKFPAYKKNVVNYRRYCEALDDEKFLKIREKLKESPYEKRLKGDGDGKYFVEKSYSKTKLYNNENGEIKVQNPFDKQVPFLRFENHITSKVGGEETVLSKFSLDEEVVPCEREFDYTDLSSKLVFKVKVRSNGTKGAVVFRLSSTFNDGKGVADYTVFTDFVGEREVLLGTVDNGNFPEFKAPLPNDMYAYSYYRSNVNYEKVDRLKVFTVGDTSGVSISDFTAVTHDESQIETLTVSHNDEQITFKTPILSGEYLEFYPETNTAKKFDRFGNETCVLFDGRMPCVDDNTILCINTKTKTGAPALMTATVGVDGKVIK